MHDFRSFNLHIVTVSVHHMLTNGITSQLYSPLFIFIHLPLIHFAPALFIDSFKKIATTYIFVHHIIMHHYAYVILSLTRLAYILSYDYLSYTNSLGLLLLFYYFLFFSDQGSKSETLDFTNRIGSTRTFFFFFYLYLYSAYAAHYVYCVLIPVMIYTD